MHFHDLRHSTATLLLRAGVDAHRVQRLLRHRDVRTTTTIYGHLDVDDLRAALEKLPQLGPNWVQCLGSKHFSARGSRETLLSVRQVARLLHVSTATIYRLCEAGEFTHLRVSHAVRIAPGDLVAYLKKRRTT
jgi:excisionase family DNA binding protein